MIVDVLTTLLPTMFVIKISLVRVVTGGRCRFLLICGNIIGCFVISVGRVRHGLGIGIRVGSLGLLKFIIFGIGPIMMLCTLSYGSCTRLTVSRVIRALSNIIVLI